MRRLLISLVLSLASCIPLCPAEHLNDYQSLAHYIQSGGYKPKKEEKFQVFEDSSAEVTAEKDETKIIGFYDNKGQGYCLRKNKEKTTYCSQLGYGLDTYLVEKDGKVDIFLKRENPYKFIGKEARAEERYFNSLGEEFVSLLTNDQVLLEFRRRIR